MLDRGDSVPHFEVKTVDDQRFSYAAIWQHRNLVLVTIPATEPACEGSYVSQLMARMPEFTAKATECVVTRDVVPGIQVPAVVVADRWGEVVHVAVASGMDALPTAGELLEWVEYLENRCPECEGEAK